jgi:transcriptional regulator with XRE-family HTH domain
LKNRKYFQKILGGRIMTTSINERLKQVRQTLGLTQGKFGERIAISISYLSDMELGKMAVNDRVTRLVAMEFGVSEHWLRTGEGEMYSEAENINAVKAASLFKSLNPSYQEGALAILDILSDLQNAKPPTT